MNTQTCKRCGYEWTPRIDISKIKSCPDCKSRRWRITKPELEYQRFMRELEARPMSSWTEAEMDRYNRLTQQGEYAK